MKAQVHREADAALMPYFAGRPYWVATIPLPDGWALNGAQTLRAFRESWREAFDAIGRHCELIAQHSERHADHEALISEGSPS
jgi:hypothetical protein